MPSFTQPNPTQLNVSGGLIRGREGDTPSLTSERDKRAAGTGKEGQLQVARVKANGNEEVWPGNGLGLRGGAQSNHLPYLSSVLVLTT